LFGLSWASNLTQAQRLGLQWMRRLNGSSSAGVAVQMTVVGDSTFVDQGTSPCDDPVPDDEPAAPQLNHFADVSEFYWARRTRFRAAFEAGVWGPWSYQPVISTKTERGIVPVLRISNAATADTVLFEREMEPLPGQEQGGWVRETVQLTRVPGNDRTLFTGSLAQNRTPQWRYVRVANGTTFDGHNQGLSFYINQSNQRTFVIQLASGSEGVWSMTELQSTITAAFASAPQEQRVTGLIFQPIQGTTTLRLCTTPQSSWPPEAGFRVSPYSVQTSSCNRALGTCNLPTEANGTNTLNQLLGFGPIPTSSPFVSGAQGQVGFYAPRFVNQT
jgi:hypothetical protein